MKRVRANISSSLYPIINPFISHFSITELENSILASKTAAHGQFHNLVFLIPILFNSTTVNNFTFKYVGGYNDYYFGISTNKTFNLVDSSINTHQ